MARAQGRQRLAAVLIAGGSALVCFAGVAAAQSQVGGFSGLSGANSRKPIDIESDKLEVDDKQHTAIFSGSVSATQGDYNLTAPRLDVFYENSAAQSPAPGAAKPPVKKAPQEAGPADPISSGQINHIHAFGGTVVLKNAKDEQQVVGEDAVYDVKSQKITIVGKKVVLTQKKNVIEGRKLLVDLNTGQATVIPDEDLPKSVGADPKGRVRAVLQQDGAAAIAGTQLPGAQKKKDETSKPAQAAPKQPQPAPGWQPQSQ